MWVGSDAWAQVDLAGKTSQHTGYVRFGAGEKSNWELGNAVARQFAVWKRMECVGKIRVNLQGHSIEDSRYWQFWRTPKGQRSTATLVVCPQPLVHQWKEQIEQHCKDRVNIVLYQNRGSTHQKRLEIAKELKDADWVLITYEELSKLNSEDAPACIEWWRIIVDEAQTMQDASLLRAAMATKLQAINRVILSGTPITIGRTVEDLSPLFKFFGIQPYCDEWFWDEGVKAEIEAGVPAETSRLEKTLGHMMTWSCKSDFSPDQLVI